MIYTLVDADGNILQSQFTTNPGLTIDAGTKLVEDTVPQPGTDFDPLLKYLERVEPVTGSAVVYNILDRSTADIAADVRGYRDGLIKDIMWRVERYNRYTFLNKTQIDDIAVLMEYIQDLADVPLQTGFPTAVEWPVAPE
jgi:hypothetical protein